MNETKRILRERKFIEVYINNGGNATESYLAINKKANRDTAGVLGLRMLRNVKVEVKNILNQIGLNDIYLAGKLKEGLESKNLSVRVRYLDMVFKLKDIYPSERHSLVVEKKPDSEKESKLDRMLGELTGPELKILIANFVKLPEEEIERLVDSIYKPKQKLLTEGGEKNV